MMDKRAPKTDLWKRSLLVTALTKAGWNFWFKEDALGGSTFQLWGSYETFKIRLYKYVWTLFEDLPTGLLEIKQGFYGERQTQTIKRAIIKVKNRRARSG